MNSQKEIRNIKIKNQLELWLFCAIIGAVAGVVGFIGVNIVKKALKYDDSLDAFGVHAMAGIWGGACDGYIRKSCS